MELEKLNRVISFALNGACRQREILRVLRRAECPAVRPLRQLRAVPATT